MPRYSGFAPLVWPCSVCRPQHFTTYNHIFIAAFLSVQRGFVRGGGLLIQCSSSNWRMIETSPPLLRITTPALSPAGLFNLTGHFLPQFPEISVGQGLPGCLLLRVQFYKVSGLSRILNIQVEALQQNPLTIALGLLVGYRPFGWYLL